MSPIDDEQLKRMQQWLDAANEDEKPKPEEGLTVEQTRDFAKRGGWIVVYLLAALALAVVATTVYAANTATITFTAVTKYVDGTAFPAGAAISYNVYQGAKGSTNKTLVGTITTTNTSITSGLLTGQEYCWEVAAVLAAIEGAHSNEGCKNFVGTPGIVVITVT